MPAGVSWTCGSPTGQISDEQDGQADQQQEQEEGCAESGE